jgi:predicted dehydrogenase
MAKAKLRAAIVGCGGMGRRHSECVSKMRGVEIVGFADRALGAAKAMGEQYGCRAFSDGVKMLDAVECDLAWLCLPPRGHGIELELAARRIPFFVEKPVGSDVGLMRKIARAVAAKKLITSAGYMNRYRKSVAKAKAAFAGDRPVIAVGGWLGGTPSEESTKKGINKWWVRRSRSGGQFHEQVTHTVDLVRYLMGEVAEVQAYAAKGINPRVPTTFTIDDGVVVNLKLRSGAVANLVASTAANAGGGGVSLRVYAPKTSALFAEWGHDLELLRSGRDPVAVKGEGDIFCIEDAAFVKAVRSRRPKGIMCTYADGARTAAVTLAANESLVTGKPVRPAKIAP